MAYLAQAGPGPFPKDWGAVWARFLRHSQSALVLVDTLLLGETVHANIITKITKR
jgi:hypothetical protein